MDASLHGATGNTETQARDVTAAVHCIRRIAGRGNRRPGTRAALLAIADQVESGIVLPDLAEYERGFWDALSIPQVPTSAALDCVVAGCRHGRYGSPQCECP